ncbi:unnamed protein product [Rotaria magnacalcarata]|uniref:Carboxypeptidase n=1 Tax=Rotaria magnacalcarata TaxID=392030 RepID=A0A819GFU4_9BILA|nr:unnamed protein product [Rotaria magnacalcarata]
MENSIVEFLRQNFYDCLLFIKHGHLFHFTKNKEGYVRNEDEVAHDLHSILTQVFQISYEYVASPFYVAGESYGGKYVPAIVRKIHVENPQAKIKINLKGMAIDDGLIDPYNQWDYGLVMYQVGLIDEQELERVSIQTQLGRRAIELKQYLLVSFNDVYNYLLTRFPDAFGYYVPWVTAIVGIALANDIMQSTVGKVTEIANNNYKILIYNGLLDVIIASSLTMDCIDKLQWQHADKFRSAERKVWKVKDTDTEVAGYLKQYNSFFVAWVRNSGHMVPADQPRSAFDLIDRIVSD